MSENLDYARTFPDKCCEEVTRRGEVQPCEKTAVAVREDEEGSPYPVCAYHARGPMVPLAALWRHYLDEHKEP